MPGRTATAALKLGRLPEPIQLAAVWKSHFDCETSPPSPSLSTRTGVLLFEAPSCSAATAPAVW
jgi:hypothetical protein